MTSSLVEVAAYCSAAWNSCIICDTFYLNKYKTLQCILYLRETLHLPADKLNLYVAQCRNPQCKAHGFADWMEARLLVVQELPRCRHTSQKADSAFYSSLEIC